MVREGDLDRWQQSERLVRKVISCDETVERLT